MNPNFAAYTAPMSAMIAEDCQAPALRNPLSNQPRKTRRMRKAKQDHNAAFIRMLTAR